MSFLGRVLTALLDVHPWHTMVVHFPVALTAVALLFVVVALWRRTEFLEESAFLCIALAAAGTAAAGLTGLRDHFVRFNSQTPYIDLKVFLGVSLLVLTALLAAVRRRNSELLWNPSS